MRLQWHTTDSLICGPGAHSRVSFEWSITLIIFGDYYAEIPLMIIPVPLQAHQVLVVADGSHQGVLDEGGGAVVPADLVVSGIGDGGREGEVLHLRPDLTWPQLIAEALEVLFYIWILGVTFEADCDQVKTNQISQVV